MARARATVRAIKSLATAEARRELPSLVRRMGQKRKPSADLLDDAVEIGPHRKGGAVLIPEVDALAHADQLAELRFQVEQLEGELEDVGMALLLEERLAGSTGKRLSAEEFLQGIGMGDHVARLPGR
ncbi:MAG: hypothetical protein QOI91_1486 [Solirubrobacteraceae bacterium]|jgi:hypothetical protein|nr:hypothetical protein [Solirubrobacteraceae bacterium]